MAKPMEYTVDQEIRSNFVKRHQQLVYFVAHQYKRSGIEWEDLVQIGYMGLVKAMDRYNPAVKRVKFNTFAIHYIQGEILHELRYRKRHNPAVEISVEQTIKGKEDGEELRLVDTLGTEPDVVESPAMNHVDLEEGLKHLTLVEREVIELRYGLKDRIVRKQEKVAEIFDVSRKRISQWEQKAMWKLRRWMIR
ncbi:sigma-70 family RNA polymerase sigma factor [Marinithermofilum abyssi]|nr:sigma-70 family RNA polymerase sigma factor [Marinithermofilum abyssi]